MTRRMQGTVHGQTIELESDPQIQDGSKVEVVLRVTPQTSPAPEVRASLSAAGMMAAHWTEEDDMILEEIYQDRKRDSRREPLE